MDDPEGQTWFSSMFYRRPRFLKAEDYVDVYGKVFRQKFGLNRRIIEEMDVGPKDVHPVFRYPCFEDVTRIYGREQAYKLSDWERPFYSGTEGRRTSLSLHVRKVFMETGRVGYL